MSKETKDQVLARVRQRYVAAGPQHKRKLITQAVELVGYDPHPAIKAAVAV